QLMRIEQKGEVIARIAKMNDTPPAEVTTMGFIPRSLDRVKITIHDSTRFSICFMIRKTPFALDSGKGSLFVLV
ncbi:DUF6470 family protein, partial [uncultured Exiguobacterium sp.]|uniref:DUF6470 family protein n=1 Tax=uncultured Exiguobacterium sp. TaxID=202669 RepID=UPI0025E31F9B